MKKIILLALFAGCAGHLYAQTDSMTVKKPKLDDQFIGVQINALISQVFNLNPNNAATANTNPYLLNYSLNSRKTGWGFRIGLGYNYSSNSTNDGITETTTKLNDLEFRAGIDRAFKISKKWSAGAGLDLVLNSNTDHTITVTNNGGGFGLGGGDSTDTKTVILSYGGGPMGWLRYHLTDRIMIGTEASFYYVSGKNTETVTITGQPSQSIPSTTFGQGTINAPVAFFLSIKF